MQYDVKTELHYRSEAAKQVSRRWFFEQCGVGVGAMALGHLLAGAGFGATSEDDPLAPKKPHHAPKAKNVIFLFMAGAPSHLEMFDNKPELAKFSGTLPPPDLLKGYRSAFINPNSKLWDRSLSLRSTASRARSCRSFCPTPPGLLTTSRLSNQWSRTRSITRRGNS